MRVATLDVAPELLVDFAKFCKDGPRREFIVKDHPLPDDARIINIGLTRNAPHTIRLLIESASFKDVPNGVTPPELPPVVFQTIYTECSELSQ